MAKIKVVIEVRGGVVQNVWSTDPETVLKIWDYDNLEADGIDDEFIPTDEYYNIG